MYVPQQQPGNSPKQPGGSEHSPYKPKPEVIPERNAPGQHEPNPGRDPQKPGRQESERREAVAVV
jgi:hypothetical protein